MQTFLPLADFAASAACLDDRRLGNQRNECETIGRALCGFTAWANHPAVRMWRGYMYAFSSYAWLVCEEYRRRGFGDRQQELFTLYPDAKLPSWLGDSAFHASHRSNLLRKDEAHYRQFGWTEPTTLPYVWPARFARRTVAR